MIATMYTLDRKDCKALGLKDVYGVHKAVYNLFPENNGQGRDFLFADKGGDWNGRKILILSHREPIQPRHGAIDCREVPAAFLDWDYYGFEVVLNPVRRDNASRKLIPVRGRENLHEWFLKKAPGLGFEVEPHSLQVSRMGVEAYAKDGTMRTHNTATFIGKLRVIDPNAFKKSFAQGIGRAKAFGFGLLQLVPLTSDIQ
ncbi:CRISPR-associated protein, Cse3 family [Desulfatibacillum aliphaticivorans]|uniref:CRISPR-associated protein, Cse3 family n=1 Tax=Desulfatibacillum aliphaticivorans TaxID=218208 RepID=B8FDH8_DESAL|nr:type I-E CRISPR-associated protein Cas6/Cse3/CasE [Desulfatibacillum aliphaticivorans]ACL06609.1 CRISPR-associated protein, Cse3 family [Desulfatibacillum aliphaticivorans]